MIAVPLVTIITAVIITFLTKPQWVATSKIVAEGAQGSSPLSSIAEQFGVHVGTQGSTASPDFYSAILKSPEILIPVASHVHTMTMGDGKKVSGYLWKLYRTKPPGPTDTVKTSADRLAKAVQTVSDPMTAVITLKVTAPAKDLSITLNREILNSTSEFLQNRRQTRAEAETKFVESRLEEARAGLSAAEATLSDFVSQNRQYNSAPQLALRYAQLQRMVMLRQQVFTTLSQAYEQARIDAMRNSSLISVLQRPEYDVSKQVPSLIKNILLAFILGVLVAMGIVIARTKLAREPLDNPADVEEFRALIREAVPRARRRPRKVKDGV